MRQVLRPFAIAVFLAGCADFPQLDAVVSDEARRAAYPSLIPVDRLLSQRNQGRLSENSGEVLLARAARLRARARILRAITELNDQTRRRIAPQLRRLGG